VERADRDRAAVDVITDDAETEVETVGLSVAVTSDVADRGQSDVEGVAVRPRRGRDVRLGRGCRHWR
jgi:hypothetical protein